MFVQWAACSVCCSPVLNNGFSFLKILIKITTDKAVLFVGSLLRSSKRQTLCHVVKVR